MVGIPGAHWFIFAEYVLLASQNPYPIIVYFWSTCGQLYISPSFSLMGDIQYNFLVYFVASCIKITHLVTFEQMIFFISNFQKSVSRPILVTLLKSRAANNSRSSDNGQPKFANVRQNRNLGLTFCPANFLLQHLTIYNNYHLELKFNFLIYICATLSKVPLCLCPTKIFLLSDQNGALVGHTCNNMSFQGKIIICSPERVPKKNWQPHFSQSSCENVTPSSATSPVVHYQKVSPPLLGQVWTCMCTL